METQSEISYSLVLVLLKNNSGVGMVVSELHNQVIKVIPEFVGKIPLNRKKGQIV